MAAKTNLTLAGLKAAASGFLKRLSGRPIHTLYGVTDGKAVGTHVEHEFHRHLGQRFLYKRGSSASGIDFPAIGVDLKVTSAKQPQSSCPFRDARQKVYGLGYHLLIFIYEKKDDRRSRTARLTFRHAIFVTKERTADYQTTYGIGEILRRGGNIDDVVAFLEERNLPLDEVGRRALAEELLRSPPELGYLTVSNALQWRLQYGRAINVAASARVAGVENLLA